MLFSVIFITFSTLRPVSAATGINHQINFQGKLVNTDGTNVTDGTYSIIFSLYTVSSAGSNIWTETQSVTVSNGIFQVNLGSVTTLPGSVDFNTDNIYLGIKVGADAEMTPRVQFTSVPQAFNSEKLGGLDKTGFIQNQTATTQTADFKINGTGNIGTSLTTPLLQSAAATALTITGNAASTWSTSSGNITLQAGGGSILLGTTTAVQSTNGLTITGGTTLALASTGANAITVDSGTTGTIGIGNTNANAKTITIGNVTGATQIVLNTGSGGVLVNEVAGSQLKVTSNAVVPTTDQLAIDNTGSTGVTTAGVNGLSINYKGGAAAVESAGERIDLQPGGTTGGTWSASRIVQNVTGPATGVTSNGTKYEGPATTGGAGTYNAINIANIGTVASGGIVRGVNITGTNSQAAGTVRGIQLNNLTAGAAVETGIDLGTGWDNLVTYNNGATVLVNGTGQWNLAQVSGTLANGNLTNSGALTVTAGTGLSGGGSVALGASTTLNLAATTVSANSYGSASSVATFTVNAQGQLTTAATTAIAIAGSQITSGTVSATVGGTGQSSYAVGDLLTGDVTNTLSKITAVASGSCLISQGVTTKPIWGACSAGSIVQVPTSNTGGAAGANVIAPTAASIVGLNVSGSTGTSSVAAIFNQANNTSPADTVQINTTSTGTQTNGLIFNHNATGGTTTNGLNVTNTLGTMTNGLQLTQAAGTFTTGINFTGTFGNLIVAPNFTVSNAGLINGQTISTAANFTGTLAVATSITNPLYTSTGNLNVTAATTNTLTLDTAGAGTVTLGANATTINVGDTTNVVRTINIGNSPNNSTINIAGNTGTDAVNIGADTGGSNTIKIGGTGVTSGSNAASTVILQGGQTALSLLNAGATLQTFTNSATAFQIQDASSNPILNIDTTYAGLITNPGFELNNTGWAGKGTLGAPTRTTAKASSGLASGTFTSTAANDGTSYAYTMSTATTYSLSFYAQAASASTITFGRQENGSDIDCQTGIAISSIGWTRYTCTFTTGGTISGSNIYVKQAGAGARQFWIDDLKLEATTASTPATYGTATLGSAITGPLSVQQNSTTAFQVTTGSGTLPALVVDSLNARVGIGLSAPSEKLMVAGNIATDLGAPSAVSLTAFTSGGTLADGTYYYKVAATDGLTGTYSSPSIETSVTISGGGGAGSILVAWTNPAAATNGTAYRVYRGASSNNENTFYSSSNANKFLDTGAAGTTGQPAVNSAAIGSRLSSNSTSFTKSLAVGLVSGSGNALAVNGASTLSGNTSISGSLTLNTIPVPGSVSTQTVGAVGSTTYTYVVTASVGGYETDPSVASSVTTGNATLSATSRVMISWNPVLGATSYNIYRTASGGTPSSVGFIGSNGSNITAFIDNGIIATSAAPSVNNTNQLIAGFGTFKSTYNTANAFQVQDASGTSLIQADTANTKVDVNGTLNTLYGGFGHYQNLLLCSESIGCGSWTLTNASDVDDLLVAPDGTTTGDQITNSAALTFGITQSVTVTPSTTYTLTWWAKLGTSANTSYQIADITHGSNIIGLTPYAATTSWKRFSVTFTTPAGTTSIGVSPAQNTALGTISIWGTQLEQGNSFGTYVQTTSTAVGTNYGLVVNSAGALVNGDAIFTGMVGVGTASPGFRLDVQGGDINTSGNIAVGGTTVITSGKAIQNATGVSSSGTITFSGLSTAGIVTNTAGGVLGTVASVPVAKGGTGAITFTTNGVLYGNGTGAVLVTAASTGVQCLVTTSSGVAPTWGSCSAGSSLQGSYTTSTGGTTPEILLDTTRNGLDIQDANTTIGATQALLAVRASATATTLGTGLFVVNASGKVGINTGSTSTTPTLSYDLSFGQGANRTIGVEAQATAATAGNNLTVQAGTGNTTGAGGLLTLQGGTAAATAASNGGGVTLQGANGSATGAGGNGGAVTINAGNGLGTGPTNGGSITLQAGSAVSTGTAGQVLVKNAGNSTVAFQVQNASSAALFTADTSNMRLGVKVTYAAMSVPGAFTTSTATTGGVLAQNSTYRYKVTAIDATGGETTPNTEVSQLTGNTTATNTITLTAWTASSGAAGYRIYRTAANGATNTETLYDTVSKPGYTDTGTGAFTAGTVPAASTAYVSTNVASTTTLSLAVGGLGSPTGQLYVSGTLPTAPVGKVNTATNPWGIYHSGNYLYSVNKGGTSLQIFDATNPASPFLLTNFAITGAGETNSVVVAGHYAYVADDGLAKFFIIDVTNPKLPVLVNTVTTSLVVGQVLVQGRYAYAFEFNFGVTGTMQIFDIGNPAAVPAALSSTTPTGATLAMPAQVLGKYVYMLTTQSSGNDKLWIYNISNPATPVLVNTGGTLLSAIGANGPVISGHYAYIMNAVTNPTLEAWDIKDPTAPFLANSVALDPAVGTPNAGSPQLFTVQGHYAYVTNPQFNDVNVVDLSNPTAMRLLGAISTDTKPIAITVNGRYMYVEAYVDSKIDIYDIGGTYTQALEVGSTVTGSLQTTGLATFDGDLLVTSSVSIGQSLQVNEDLGVSGTALFGSATNSTSAFQVQNATGVSLITADTTTSTVKVGTLTSGASLDVMSNVAADIGKFRSDGSTAGILLDSHTSTSPNGIRLQATWNGSDNDFIVLAGGAERLRVRSNGNIQIGSATTDASQFNLQLDSSSTYADSGTCNTTTNQGALYYNTASDSIRSCSGALGWDDVATIKNLGILAFGVMPDSGSNPGDLSSLGTTGVSGPCKVSWATATSVNIAACTAYSGGRKVVVTATSLSTAAIAINSYTNVCLTGANNQPALGTANTTETSAAVPTFSLTAPILCLATLKIGGTLGNLANIYDVRTYTTSVKTFATLAAVHTVGWITINSTTTAGQVAVTAVAQTAGVRGVIVAGSGASSTTTPNVIIAINGPVNAKGSANSVGQFITTAGATGTVGSTATGTLGAFVYAGIAQKIPDVACNAVSNCQYSTVFDMEPR